MQLKQIPNPYQMAMIFPSGSFSCTCGGSSVAVAGVEVDAAVTIANTSAPGSKIYLDAMAAAAAKKETTGKKKKKKKK